MEALRYSVEPVVERVCKEIVLQLAEVPGAGALADKGREVRVKTRNPICAMAVRERFDDFCLKQTLAQGAELRKIEGVVALREVDGGVEVDVALSDGSVETLTTPVVIGADGSNGQMRRLEAMLADGVEAQAAKIAEEPEWYARGFALEAMVPYAALPAKLPEGDGPLDLVFDFSPIVGGYGWLFPKGDHINIGVGGFVPRTDNAANNDRPHEKVTRALLHQYTMQKLGVDLGAVGAQVTGQYLGLGGHAYVPRVRVLLVGDAAGLVDPLTGEGIHSALVSGQAAAAAVLGSASGESVAEVYARELAGLQETLAFSHRAARSFYATPERGFKVMRTPILRSLVLKTYADGLPHTKLLARLAKAVA